MKTLKKIVIALVLVFTAYIFISFLLPSKVRVERSVIITAPNGLIFEQINNFHNWQHWSHWDNIDPEMRSVYEGPESGTGAIHRWTSQNKEVGNGSLQITASVPDASILTDLTFNNRLSHGGWTIRDTTDGACVSTYMEMDMGLMERILPGLMMDSFLGPAFEKSLEALKKRCEALKLEKPAASALAIEQVACKEQLYLSVKLKTNLQSITNDISAAYMKIGAYMKQHNIPMAGPVCAFYNTVAPDHIDMEAAIPIAKAVKTDGEVQIKARAAGMAAVAHYYGSYLRKDAAYAALESWIKANNKKVSGAPWEVYVTDPMMEKDTSRWLTDVYYPIE